MRSDNGGGLRSRDRTARQTGVLPSPLCPRDRAGQGGVLTTAPPGLAPFPPPQSPNLAMSAPGSPTLAPAQLCSWPPPAAPVAGPRARAGAADTTTQLQARPRARSTGRAVGTVIEGQGRKGGRHGGGLWLREGLVFGNLDCHHQGLCFLPQAHVCTHTEVYTRCSLNTCKTTRIPLMWLYGVEGNKGP